MSSTFGKILTRSIITTHPPRRGWRGYFRLLHPGGLPCWYMSMAATGRSGKDIILATLDPILVTSQWILFYVVYIFFSPDPKCQPDRHSKSFPWCSGQGTYYINVMWTHVICVNVIWTHVICANVIWTHDIYVNVIWTHVIYVNVKWTHLGKNVKCWKEPNDQRACEYG